MSNENDKIVDQSLGRFEQEAEAAVDESENRRTEAFADFGIDSFKDKGGATTKTVAPKPPIIEEEPTPTVRAAFANDIDLDRLDESTLMKYDIKVQELNNAAMMTLKPASSSIVLRWVYCGANNGSNEGQSNVNRRRMQGFEFATLEDIEGGASALVDAILDGDRIKYYDVVLMKISKLRLMGHYKFNLVSSMKRVDGSLAAAKKGAEAQLVREAGPALARAKQSNQRVEIYVPPNAELRSDDPSFLS